MVAGQATIAQQGGTTQVTQASQRAVMNWQSFNVGAAEAVMFSQPSSSAAILNRIVAGDASQILGRISANGQVYVVNPNGIVFGRTAQVDVGGLLATTSNIAELRLHGRAPSVHGGRSTGRGRAQRRSHHRRAGWIRGPRGTRRSEFRSHRRSAGQGQPGGGRGVRARPSRRFAREHRGRSGIDALAHRRARTTARRFRRPQRRDHCRWRSSAAGGGNRQATARQRDQRVRNRTGHDRG